MLFDTVVLRWWYIIESATNWAFVYSFLQNKKNKMKRVTKSCIFSSSPSSFSNSQVPLYFLSCSTRSTGENGVIFPRKKNFIYIFYIHGVCERLTREEWRHYNLLLFETREYTCEKSLLWCRVRKWWWEQRFSRKWKAARKKKNDSKVRMSWVRWNRGGKSLASHKVYKY